MSSLTPLAVELSLMETQPPLVERKRLVVSPDAVNPMHSLLLDGAKRAGSGLLLMAKNACGLRPRLVGVEVGAELAVQSKSGSAVKAGDGSSVKAEEQLSLLRSLWDRLRTLASSRALSASSKCTRARFLLESGVRRADFGGRGAAAEEEFSGSGVALRKSARLRMNSRAES